MTGASAWMAATAVLLLVPSLSAHEPTPPIARHQEPGEVENPYQEIASPMLIEVSLGTTPRRKSIQELEAKHPWVTTETNKYICQQVHVRVIEVWKEENRGKVKLHFVAALLSEESPKDVDITLSVVSDSKEIRRRFWHEFTADPVTRHPRSPEAEFDFSSQEFTALFSQGRAPSVRVVLNVLE